ncbi:MAG: formate acetyltransferase, partial [Pseudanabaenaceae cyanobacterium]
MDRDTFEREGRSDAIELRPEWQGFKPHVWQNTIDVRDFIQYNYTPYTGDGTFLAGATDRTQKLWAQVQELMRQEREKGVLDADTSLPSSITA